MFELYNKDAYEFLMGLEPESVDLIVTDPAYSSLEKHRGRGTTTRLKAEWFSVVPNAYFERFAQACYRALAKNSHLYFICDQETMFATRTMFMAAGFTWWKFLVWDKEAIGMGYHYRNQHEVVCFFEKGKRRLNDLGMGDVRRHKRIKCGEYPTEKPVTLLKDLIVQSTEPGQRVCDPFMGSGSAGVATLELGRTFVGNDLELGAVGCALRRLGGRP